MTKATDVVLLPDANVFLQCRPLEELAFDALGFSSGVHLVVSRSVQKEIDRLKSDGSPRRSKRARGASSLFRKTLREPGGVLRVTAGCSLELMPPQVKPKFDGALDPHHSDDVHVAEALAYKEAHPDRKVIVLSGDSGLLATARHEGQAFADVPDDWLSPPEPTETDKRVVSLESRLKRFESSQPAVTLTVVDSRSRHVEEVTIERTRFAPLTQAQLDELVALVKTLRPMETSFEPPPEPEPEQLSPFMRQMTRSMAELLQHRPAKPEEISDYQQSKYPHWLKSVREALEQYPAFIDERHRTLPLSIQIENAGSVPAEHLRLELEAHGAVALKLPPSTSDADRGAPELEDPPEPPRGVALGDFLNRAFEPSAWMHQPYLGGSRIPIESLHRDRHAFYVVDGSERKGCPEVSFECDEFRHGVEATTLHFEIIASEHERTRARQSALLIRATAKNLSTPAAKSHVVRVIITEGDSLAAAKRWLTERFPPQS